MRFDNSRHFVHYQRRNHVLSRKRLVLFSSDLWFSSTVWNFLKFQEFWGGSIWPIFSDQHLYEFIFPPGVKKLGFTTLNCLTCSFFSYVPSQSFKFVKNFFKSSSDTSGGMDGGIFDIQGLSIVDQLTEVKKN